MAALVWLVVGLILLGLLVAGVDLDGLIAAGLAALLLSLGTALIAMPITMQMLVFSGALLVVLQGLRWWSSRRRGGALPSTLASEQAEVLSGFERDERGRVLWQGQSWGAVNLAPQTPLRPGARVSVMGREGTRLQILPDSNPPRLPS